MSGRLVKKLERAELEDILRVLAGGRQRWIDRLRSRLLLLLRRTGLQKP